MSTWGIRRARCVPVSEGNVPLRGAVSDVIPLPALAADNGQPKIVDEPDTSGLNNTWTFAPAGVPIFGAIQSVSEAPQKLLPS
jgi:hypothetical protein